MTRGYDLLVVGAGIAGMTAAARAASLGLSTLVAGNSSTLVFSSGLMDCLGVYPPGATPFLVSPDKGLDQLVSDFPSHPYGLAGREKIEQGFEFISDILNNQGLSYTLSEQENIPILTAMGTIKPSFLVPSAMRLPGGQELFKKKGNLVIAGIQGLAGFSAAQVAGGLGKQDLNVIPVQVSLPGFSKVVPPQVLAQALEEPKLQEALIKAVLPYVGEALACGVPAVLGVEKSREIINGLSSALGCPVFEIPCAPPSVPGLRLKNAFETHLSQKGVGLMSNTRLANPVFDGKRFTLTAMVEPKGIKIRTRGVILATGRFFGQGLHARRERIVEPLFHLDISQPVGRGLWHDARFLTPEGHGINRAGVETDKLFRPLDERGRPVYEDLYAAGSILAHNDWARLKSGAGVSIVSAISAVDAFYSRAGGKGEDHGD